MEFKFTRSARKHRVGRARALYVISNATEAMTTTTNQGALGHLIIGRDDRGVELEITFVATDDVYLVIHVMPTSYRSQPQKGEQP